MKNNIHDGSSQIDLSQSNLIDPYNLTQVCYLVKKSYDTKSVFPDHSFTDVLVQILVPMNKLDLCVQ